MGLTDLQTITRDHVVLPPQLPAFERGLR